MKNSKSVQFDLTLISKYRTELMGFATIGVLVMHLVSIGQIKPTIPIRLLSVIPSLAFTETFLILSGLGIYNSLSHNCNLKVFYKKRLFRLIIPYLMMAFVPVLLYELFGKEQPIMFFYRLSMLDFWFGDGCLGMWYLAVSIVLYLLAPLFFKLHLFEKEGRLLIVMGGG